MQNPDTGRRGAQSDAGDQSAFVVLRRGGTSAAMAMVQLGMDETRAARLEKVFRAQACRGAGDRQLPKFAHHEAHVAAVMAQGGFPALSERRGPGGGLHVGLPLIWPAKRKGGRNG